MNKSTITLTFGDQGENHVGMQKIGKLAEEGFSIENLEEIKEKLTKSEVNCELIQLNDALKGTEYEDKAESAAILIIRKGVNAVFGKGGMDDKLFKEQSVLDSDKKAFMYGKVVNKKARYNLCFAEEAQEPNYEEKRGRIVAFKDVPILRQLRNALSDSFGSKFRDLIVEANYYYDVKKCYIGFHGDAERRKVVAVRLGATFPLYYQWHYQSKPIGKLVTLTLNHGDIYIMSEKAVGTDWKKRSLITLRHAAGDKKILGLV